MNTETVMLQNACRKDKTQYQVGKTQIAAIKVLTSIVDKVRMLAFG